MTGLGEAITQRLLEPFVPSFWQNDGSLQVKRMENKGLARYLLSITIDVQKGLRQANLTSGSNKYLNDSLASDG